MNERRGQRSQEPQQDALEPPADPAQLKECRGEHDDGRLHDDVAMAHVRELVCQHRLELRRRRRRQEARAHCDRRTTGPTTGGERTWQPVVDQVEPRLRDACTSRESLDRGVEPGRTPDRELARAYQSECDAVCVPVEGAGQQHAAEDEDGEEAIAAECPTDQAEECAGCEQQRPRLEDVPNDEKPASQDGGLVAVFLLESARRPVILRGVATARTVERGDVLQWNENVSVQLDVGDVLHVAIGRQDTFLILAPEQRDLHLLALVFVCVVLHRGPQSSGASFPSLAPYLATEQLGTPGISL